MLKKKYALIFSFLILVSIITIISCGRKGTLNPSSKPHIEISEYSGIAKPDTLMTDEMLLFILQTNTDSLINTDIYDSLFYQQIFWRAWDEDGTVKGYAYRIGTWDTLDADEDNYKWNDDPTKTFWDYDNAYGIVVDDEGWVYHYAPGADQTIPLSDPEAKKTIWTSPNVVSAKVYFPSTDTTDFRNNFGRFEVKCKDNRDNESEKSAVKYFVTHSEIPTTYISTSQGNIDSCRVGTAILFKFMVNDNDPFGIGKEAAYYKYRLVHVERVGAREDTLGKGFDNYKFSIGTEILPSSDTTWYSTEGFEKPDEVLLRAEYPIDDPYADRKPYLIANDINELTQMQVKAVDKAGIEDPKSAQMTFFVRDYFKPETRAFVTSYITSAKCLNILPNIYVLGENHYITYLETEKEIPKKVVGGKYHYATQFYYNSEGNLTGLWSDDMEIHLKWEYFGEYMEKSVNSQSSRVYKGYSFHYDRGLPAYTIGEDLLLSDGYCKYYCDIEYMDIQLDSTTTGLPPISTEIVSDEFGDWMRVPIYKDQECKLFNLLPGKHIFRVRAVDFQGAVDSTPESLEFELVQMNEEKDGVLIVDDTPCDTPGDNLYAPEAEVDAFYDKLVEDCTPVTVYDIAEIDNISGQNSSIGHRKIPYFAPSDIINYKLIIWHANNALIDFQNSKCHFRNHYNLLSIFLDTGGNLLFTGGPTLREKTTENKDFLQEYAGFSENNSTMNKSLPIAPTDCDFVLSTAVGLGSYNNLNINPWLIVRDLGSGSSCYYSQNFVINGNFSAWQDNLPVNWTAYDSTSLIIEHSSRELIISDTTGLNYVFQNISLDLEDITSCDSVKFKLQYKSKQETENGHYKIEVCNLTNNNIIEIYHTNSSSKTYTDYFFIPTTCDSIQLRLWTSESDIPGQKSYWDNVSLKFGYYYPEYYKDPSSATYILINGIGGITYFDLDKAIPIYSFGGNGPNAEGYIGSKYTKDNSGTTYILGFPLYYIHLDDAKQFIHKVFDEVGISY